jgi:hypothetical protein
MQVTPPVTVNTFEVTYEAAFSSTSQGSTQQQFGVKIPFELISSPPVGYTPEDFVALADAFALTVASYYEGLTDVPGSVALTKRYPFAGDTTPETL